VSDYNDSLLGKLIRGERVVIIFLVISSQPDRLHFFEEIYYILYPRCRSWINFDGTITPVASHRMKELGYRPNEP